LKRWKEPDVNPSPPRLAVRLLRLRLPKEVSEAIIGDLTEEFDECVEVRGKRAASVEFWWETLRIKAGPLRREAKMLRRAQSLRYGINAPERAASTVFSRTMTEMLGQDLKLAMRRLNARRGFTAVALVSLALGIGANTTVFSLVNSIFFQGSGVTEPDRAVQIFSKVRSGAYWSMSEVQYEAIREDLGALFESVSISKPTTGYVEGDGGTETVYLNVIGPDFFKTLGLPPVVGRDFSTEEHEVDGAFPVAVIGHGFWTRRFGATPDIIGTEIILNARSYTVVGVTNPDYRGSAGLVADVFVPMGMSSHVKDDAEEALVWTGFARLRDDVSVTQVQAGLDAVGVRLSRDLPEGAWQTQFSVKLESDVGVHPGIDEAIRPMAILSMGAALLVLLVACTNLAGFLLAQGADRRKEFAIRLALGAERTRVVAQLVVEALLLGVVGGLMGIGVAWLLIGVLGEVSPPVGFPIHLSLEMDFRVMGFAVAVMLFASVVFGLLPALQASRPEVASTLRDEAVGTGEGRAGGRMRRLLVISQVGLSMVILVGAGLLMRSLQAQLATDPGFATEGIAIITVEADPSGVTESTARRQLYARLLEEAAQIPGVEQVALASRLPLQVANWGASFTVPGLEPPAGQAGFRAETSHVSAGFFELMDIPIISGRAFTAEDGPGLSPAVIVNEALAEALWPGQDPVGFALHPAGMPEVTWTVVGVAAQSKVKTFGESDGFRFLYQPILQSPPGVAKVLMRGALPPAEMAGRTARMIKDVDPTLVVPEVGTMGDHLGVLLYLPRLGTMLLGAFGVLALVLAAIGLYGIVSYTVARRTREVGIRMSLGARGEEVVRLMMNGGLGLVIVGALGGLVAALAAGRLMQGFLFGVNSWDPVTLITVPVVLGAVGCLASWLPARRASRVDPVQALRAE
jgi:putative ABC transport system permease protein